MRATLEDFGKKTRQVGECWIWNAGRNGEGTPTFSYQGSVMPARRAALLFVGRDIEGRQVKALCGNRDCVNPDHMTVCMTAGERREMEKRERDARKPTRLQQFMAKVRKTDTCWEWTGGFAGPSPHAFFQGDYAYRYAWEVFNGPIPEGLHVCHTCDNGMCVNPDHLFVGTAKDNMMDCARKLRRARKLEPGQVIEIRRRRAAGEEYGAIARSYGISRSAVRAATIGETWVWLEQPQVAA